MVQWLRFCASNAGDSGSIPGQGMKIPLATWCGQKMPSKTSVVCREDLPEAGSAVLRSVV